ncbi:hypothetical protein [Streptomyces sp. NBC_01012]|uniref:hypothetical protein n=1 Tax=Streptomyces sp. NBC_01012 TaxID=2903717 RepID=UPI0038682BF7|nr:hypothetical protein OG623_12215 [Streptomyces sp. NBC_01012]
MSQTPRPSPAEASAALRTAEQARAASARPRRPLPRWYAPANGLLLLVGLSLIGVSWLLPSDDWKPTTAVQLVGALLIALQCVLTQRIEHRPGIIRTTVSFLGRGQLLALYLTPVALGVLLAIPFGRPALFLTVGIGVGLTNWGLLSRERVLDRAAASPSAQAE